MESLYSVKLGKLIQEFNLEVLRGAEGYAERPIRTEDVNRPGLQLTGFFDYFDPKRLQVIGRVETTYLSGLTEEQRRESFEQLLSQEIPALIISRGMEPYPECMEMAEKYDRTILRSQDTTSVFMSNVIAALKNYLSPRITRHGVLVDVYGEGVLLLGESGVGKSETAIELVKRGHRLIADDAVEIKRTAAMRLMGSAPELIRHYIELRGIGVIDVQQLFGMGSVQFDTELDLVVQLEKWVDGKFYDRLGLGEEMYSILGVKLPYMIIPVRPGRNLAGIVEIATMKNRQMKFGYNPARDFVDRVDRQIDALTRQSEEQK